MPSDRALIGILRSEDGDWLSRRVFFAGMALLLLWMTTERFDGDTAAFLYALIVLGGVMFLE